MAKGLVKKILSKDEPASDNTTNINLNKILEKIVLTFWGIII